MKTIMDLKAKAGPVRSERPAGTPVLYIEKDDEVPAATSGLMDFFARDDTVEGIDLVIAGDEAGFLAREALYDVVDFEAKGLGDGDLTTLPGLPKYRLQVLHCPQPGCTCQYFVTYYSPIDSPFCEIHCTIRMEPMP